MVLPYTASHKLIPIQTLLPSFAGFISRAQRSSSVRSGGEPLPPDRALQVVEHRVLLGGALRAGQVRLAACGGLEVAVEEELEQRPLA